MRSVVGVGNGTDALTLILRALGIGPGDEVIVPALTFWATAEAVIHAGAQPVVCDVHPLTLTMTAAHAKLHITGRTACLLPVHLFGNPAPMDDLRLLARRECLALVEDACQALGAEYKGSQIGTLGDAAAFSFYPSKNLPCFGDGGAVATNSETLAQKVRRLRNHDERMVGTNSRLDEIQAASLRVLLPHLGGWTRRRREIAARYASALPGAPVEAQGGRSCFHVYAQRTTRTEIAGIETRRYYPTPLHRLPALHHLSGPLPNAEAAHHLALPMGPGLTDTQVEAVIRAAKEGIPQ